MESAKTEQISHNTRCRAKFSHKPGAVGFQRPYLPHFSSKSYKVWSVRFLTSRSLKWYIECKKWTLESAPKVRNKTVAAVLFVSLHFACFSSFPLFFPCILWTTLAKGYGAPKLGSSWIWASKSFAISCASSSSIIWHAWIDS